MTRLQSVYYQNDTKKDQIIIIEPWAEEFIIPPGKKYEIVVYVIDDGKVPKNFGKSAEYCMSISSSENEIVFYSPIECLMHVYVDGKPLEPSSQTGSR